MSDTRIHLASVYYDPFTGNVDTAMSVELTEDAVAVFATMTDFELKVTAAEAGIRVRMAIEMPPSPNDPETLSPQP